MFSVWFWYSDAPEFCRGSIGFVGGALFAALIRAFMFCHLWPVLFEIVKWERVEELIQENEARFLP
jgi:hypothetical protein